MPSYSSIKPSTTFGTDAGKTYIQAGVDSATITNLIPTTSGVSSTEDLSPTGNSIGDQALVGSSLYIWNGVGWYSIALINTSPTWDSGGQPLGSYALDADSPQDPTIITLSASDPEGIPIQYSYVTSGQMDSIATISQDSSVFTITPKTETQVPAGGTGSITFRATDGVNILPAVSSFTLNFVTIVDDSRYTVLLATADGTSDNNNITDGSSSSHSITTNGSPNAGTFSPYRNGGYSAYWGGQTNISSAITAIGTSNFTIEAWINFSSISGSPWILDGRYDASNNGYGNGGIGLRLESSGKLRAQTGQSGYIDGTTVLSTNTWHHVMVVRSGTGTNEFKVYLNGNLEVQGTDANSKTCTYIRVGSSYLGGNNPSGYIRDLRISTTARDTTTPTEPVEADSDTIWLGCSLPYFADASSSNNSLTITGDLEISPLIPYNREKYSATNHGGSIYFPVDSGSRLTSASSNLELGTGDFTIEGWIYHKLDGSTSASYLFDYRTPPNSGSAHSFLYIEGSVFKYGYGAYGQQIISGTVKENTWYHWAVCRSGTSTKLFLNGKQAGSTFTDNINYQGQQPYIGRHNNVTSLNAKGYLSDVRITKSALYTADFNPPTAPLSSTNSVLHMKGTDASLIDKAQSSNLNLTGNTTGSTTQVKFAGSKSMYFDGTGDYLETTAFSEAPVFGTGNWTVEGWFYATDLSNFRTIINQDASWELTLYGSQLRVVVDTDGSWNRDYVNLYSMSGTLSLNTWYHFALVKNGNSVKGYTDGTEYYSNASFTSSPYSTPSKKVRIGRGQDSPYYWQGYLQDIRISKGLARYTANFTPPTASLEG